MYIYIYPQVYVYILERLGTEDTKTIKDTQIKKNIYRCVSKKKIYIYINA